MESINDNNKLKWAKIKITIQALAEMPKEHLNDLLFKNQVYASVKYDGTNVGRDETGLMYGRNKTIQQGTKVYQKAPLDEVRDTAVIKDELLKQTGIPAGSIDTVVVYGELMCNKDRYRYNEDNLFGTWQVFGAMIKPANIDVIVDITQKLADAKFSCKVRSPSEDESEDEADSEISDEKLVMLVMNQTFNDLVTSLGFTTVPAATKMGTFFELVISNYDFMVKGFAEGLIVVSPAIGSEVQVSKWKIGAEKNTDNADLIKQMLSGIETWGTEWFQENATKAKELFEKMLEIQSSQAFVAPAMNVAEILNAQYDEAVKSARSKFDHCDVYFAKANGNPVEYYKLIAQETLSDIKVDSSKKALDAHYKMVANFIKPDFAQFKSVVGQMGHKSEANTKAK